MRVMGRQLTRREVGLAIVASTGASGYLRAQVPSPPPSARVKSSVMLWTLKGNSEEQLATAARAGVQSVELVTEYVKWSNTHAANFKAMAQSYGLGIDALLSSYDWTKRPVTMVNPEHRNGFLSDVRIAIEWAQRLGVPQIILMSGNEQPGMSHEAQYASMVESAKRAADLAAAGNVTMILENLNSKVNHPGYFLTSARESLKCVKEVDSPRLRMLFDIYHEAVQHGDPIPAIIEAEPFVAVFHVADEPGRNDPGTGKMKWDDIYKAIGKTTYSGISLLNICQKAMRLRACARP